MKKVLKISALIVIGVLAVGAFTWVTQLLWNWLLPGLFGVSAISFWQALGLLALSKILFSGLGMGRHRNHHGHKWGYWRKKWESMSPEQREQYRERIRQKYGERWAMWGEKWCRPTESQGIAEPQKPA